MATTYQLIRDQQLTVIEALTPSFRADVPFRRHKEPAEFVGWAEENKAACWRRFEILCNFDIEKQGIGDGNKWQLEHSMTLIVAYPREFGKYGAANERSLDVCIIDDFVQIDEAIGPDGASLGNWVSGLDDCRLGAMNVTKNPGAILAAYTYRLLYDRSY